MLGNGTETHAPAVVPAVVPSNSGGAAATSPVSVDTARVLAHGLVDMTRAHRAIYQDLQECGVVAQALTALLHEFPRELGAGPLLQPLQALLRRLSVAVRCLVSSQPEHYDCFRPRDYAERIVSATDKLASVVKAARSEAQALRQQPPGHARPAQRAALCELLLVADRLAAQFWSIAFGPDTFEVARGTFSSCCARVVEQDWLDTAAVENAVDKLGSGLITILDLADFIERHKGFVKGLAAVCNPAATSIFSWGYNRMGECGPSMRLGDSSSKPLRLPWRLDGRSIRQVACDRGISVAVLENGEVYTWGSMTSGKLGHRDQAVFDDSSPVIDEPARVRALEGCRVTYISCSETYAAAITEDGQLFTWGGFSDEHAPTLGHRHGEVLMGTEHGRHYSPIPTPVRALRSMRVTCVSCGPQHAAAVMAHGAVYCWGCGDRGRLGIGSEVDAWAPQQVTDLSSKQITRVACGSVHTMALTILGAIFVWGGARSGKLGLGGVGFCDTFVHRTRSGQPFVPRPKAIGALSAVHVSEISAGRAHSSAVTEEGALYTWGCGKDGKLGHGGVDTEWLPRRVSSLLTVNIVQASCGRDHTAGATDTGWLFSWGKGRLTGTPDDSSRQSLTRPARVSHLTGLVKQVACGRYHTLAVVTSKIPSDESVAHFERQLSSVLRQADAGMQPSAHAPSAVPSNPNMVLARSGRSSHSSMLRGQSSMSAEPNQPVLQPTETIGGGVSDTQSGHRESAGRHADIPHQSVVPHRATAAGSVEAQPGLDDGSWRYRFEEERRKADQLRQELEDMRSLHWHASTVAGDRNQILGATPYLDATMDALQSAKEDEEAGLRAAEAGRQKKLAAAVQYHRVYQSLEALADHQTGYGESAGVEQQLDEVGSRLVQLRSELGVEQLRSALVTDASAQHIPFDAVLGPEIDGYQASVSTAPNEAGDGPMAVSDSADSADENLFDKSMAIFQKISPGMEAGKKRELLGSFIESLEGAIALGSVRKGALERAEGYLDMAKSKMQSL